MPNSPPLTARLSAATASLLVIDVQDKLLVKIPTADALVRNVGFLLDAAHILGVPVAATEQYPQGLGPTTAALARRLPADRPHKVAFSCCSLPAVVDALSASGRPQVVLAGMESHVCVLQTGLDLLQAGWQVFLPVDGVASRSALDHDWAVRRLERAGAVPTTCEATVFEWLGSAAHPRFKEMSRLIKEREVVRV